MNNEHFRFYPRRYRGLYRGLYRKRFLRRPRFFACVREAERLGGVRRAPQTSRPLTICVVFAHGARSPLILYPMFC